MTREKTPSRLEDFSSLYKVGKANNFMLESQKTPETLILILCLENSMLHISLSKSHLIFLSGIIRTPSFKLTKRNKPKTALLSHNDNGHVP